MVGQHRAADTFRMDEDFERIAFDLGGHRAAQHGAGLAVVGGGAEHQRGAVSSLFVPGLRRAGAAVKNLSASTFPPFLFFFLI